MRTSDRHVDFDIIIIHYHAARLVRDAVDALQRDAEGSGLGINIIVVDNGSTDQERQELQSLAVRYTNSGRDAGYAGGVNHAFGLTTADFLILMSEDLLVVPGCLGTLLDALKGGAGAAGPEFLWDLDRTFVMPPTEERTRENELLKAEGRLSLEKLAKARRHWREFMRLHWRATRAFESSALSGALIAFRRDTWEKIGPFDEGFQLYFEDNDWILRVEAAGLRPTYVPAAKCIHLHNPKVAQDADRLAWLAESFERFGKRYYGEEFMRRLRGFDGIRPVVPGAEALPFAGDMRVEIDIPAGNHAWPLWVELTPSPVGFPAVATLIADPATKRWRLPPMRGLRFATGTYYLQLVDDDGREIKRYSFQRREG